MPRVTVLMPAYNAAKYIAEAIRSVLGQSFADFELLIVDDGSTDDTLDIVKGFSDPRIRLFSQTNGGISAALNNGLRAASGQYIARFDADDICLPERLGRQVSYLDEEPGCLVVGSDAEYISENGEHLFDFQCRGHSPQEIMDELYSACPFIHSGVMYRKDAIVAAGGYSQLAYNFEDHLLWVQLLHSGNCANLPEALIKVRINPNSVTIDEKWRGRRFRRLKKRIIRRGRITEEEGAELSGIIGRQQTRKIKVGAYHALCGKKLLANNYHPVRARWHISRAIHANPLRWDNYAILVVSFLPQKFIKWIHRAIPGKM